MPTIKGDCPSNLLEELRKQYNALKADMDNLVTKYNAMVTLVNELKTDMSAHTHTENTAGTYTQNATTAAAPTISAASATTASVTASVVNRS